MDIYPHLVSLHVVGAFLFVLFHGASAGVVLRLRRETEVPRIAALLDLSRATLGLMYLGALLMLVGGIWAGIEGSWFTNGQLWLWTSIALLVLVAVAMFVFISRHFYAVRELLAAAPAPDDAVVVERVHSTQPLIGAAIGLVGLVVIVWLMVAKPF